MNPAANFERAAAFIRSAAQQGCTLAVLPEYHLTNWLPQDAKFIELCADWRSYLERYQALARECNICIVPGTIVQTRDTSNDPVSEGPAQAHGHGHVTGPHDSDAPPASARADHSGGAGHSPATSTGGPTAFNPQFTALQNTAYFIGNDGAILGEYTKKNLWGPTERAHLTSSGRDAHPVFDTPMGKVGMLICWDLAFPEAFRELVRQGAKIIVLPTFCELCHER